VELKAQFLKRFGNQLIGPQALADLFLMKQEPSQAVKKFATLVQNKGCTYQVQNEYIFAAIHNGFLSHIRADLTRTATIMA
jgi:hypothetical protein